MQRVIDSFVAALNPPARSRTSSRGDDIPRGVVRDVRGDHPDAKTAAIWTTGYRQSASCAGRDVTSRNRFVSMTEPAKSGSSEETHTLTCRTMPDRIKVYGVRKGRC